MLSDAEEPSRPRVSTTMRWQPIVLFLPVAVLINAAVAYLGWLIWTRF